MPITSNYIDTRFLMSIRQWSVYPIQSEGNYGNFHRGSRVKASTSAACREVKEEDEETRMKTRDSGMENLSDIPEPQVFSFTTKIFPSIIFYE